MYGHDEIGYASHECWKCHKPLMLHKAVKLDVGNEMKLLLCENCADGFNTVIDQQVQRYRELQNTTKQVNSAIKELKDGNEIVQKSSAVPFKVTKENN